MTTFAPTLGEIIVSAFSRIMVRRTELTVSHLSDARSEANLLQVQWGNRGPNLWTVDQQEMALVEGQVTYPLPPDTIDMLDTYLSTGAIASDANADSNLDANLGAPFMFDRALAALGRSEYLAIPNKQQQGMPTSFWFQRGLAPQVNVWPAPDQGYTLYFWRTAQIPTASVSGAATPTIPYLWIDAFTAGLSHRLARIYAPQMEALRRSDADEAWKIAADQDTEKTPMILAPDVSRYYR